MFVHTHIVGVFHHFGILLSRVVYAFSPFFYLKNTERNTERGFETCFRFERFFFSKSDNHDNIIEPILLLCHFLQFVFLFLVKCSTPLQVFLSILLL